MVGRRVLPLRLKSLALPVHRRGATGAGLAALSSGLTSLKALDLEGGYGPGVTSQALSGWCSALPCPFLGRALVVA